MGGKNITGSNKYALRLIQTMRRMAVIVAFVTILYAISAELSLVTRSPQYTLQGGIIISLLVMTFALWAYFHPYKTQSSKLAYFIIPFHALGISLPLLLTGFLSPVTMFWIILIVVTGSFFGKKAMLYSANLLFITALFSIYTTTSVVDDYYLVRVFDHLSYALSIIILSWFIGSLQAIHDTEHADFMRTEQKRTLEQSRVMTLINSLNEAVISINSRGIIQLYNAAMLNLLDTNESLAGKHVNDVLALKDSSGESFKLLKPLQGKAPAIVRDDLEYTFSDGETIRVSLSTSKIRSESNEVVGYILVLRDITREKSLDEERDEFISVVSHELRTPITITEGTISNAQLLIQKGAAPTVVKQALDSAHEQIVYLARMMNDLSTLSRAERGVGGEKERINVQEFAHEIFRDYQARATQKGLRFNIDIAGNPGYVKVSRLYLEEILQNFLTNAIKYTQKGSVDFKVHVANGQVIFAVHDTGIGISKKEQTKIFHKFYRSEDYRTRETNGTGLGLYIVQKLAKKLGTKIELESRLNQGSTFSIAIPLTAHLDSADEPA